MVEEEIMKIVCKGQRFRIEPWSTKIVYPHLEANQEETILYLKLNWKRKQGKSGQAIIELDSHFLRGLNEILKEYPKLLEYKKQPA